MTATRDASSVEKLETQVDGILKQLDEVIKLHAAPGAPETDNADATGSEKDNGAAMRRRLKTVDKRDKSGDDNADDSTDLAKKIEDLEKELAVAKAKAADCDGDEEVDKKDMFNFKTKKRAEDGDGDDESLTLSGQTIRKSEVGEAQFEIFKDMNTRLEKSQEEIQKHKDEAEMANLRKRADDEFPFVPGTTDERAAMLKAITGLPKEVRKSMETALATANKLAKSGFDRVGVRAGDIEGMQKSAVSFDTKVSEIKKRDNCTRTEALEKARKEDPDGFKAYQGQS